jgi:glycine cleavage system aminomethyltransferase T
MSIALGQPVALGYVQREFMASGTAVAISHGDTPLSATVTELPFVSKPGV